MASPGFVGIDPVAARGLAAITASWSTQIDDVVTSINQAETLSDIPAGASLMLFEIASDGRRMAGALRQAADSVETHRLSLDAAFDGLAFAPPTLRGTGSALGFEPGFGQAAKPPVDLQAAIKEVEERFASLPLGGTSAVDTTTASLDQVRNLWAQADHIDAAAAAIPDDMAYARPSVVADAVELRQHAWAQVAELGVDPGLVIGALAVGGVDPRQVARAIRLQRAHQLRQTADGLTGRGLWFEQEGLRAESDAILNELFLSSEAQAVVDRFGHRLDPFQTAALVDYAVQAGDGGAAVLDSLDPMRVLQVMSQGYTQVAALDFVAAHPGTGTGTGAMTFAELEYELTRLETNHATNSTEFDVTLRELNERTAAISGEIYVRADLDAVRLADRFGVGYGDALATLIDDRISGVNGPPRDRDMQMAAIEADLALLVQVRQAEAHAAVVAAVGGSPSDQRTQRETIEQARLAQPDPAAQAARLRAMIGAGASIFLAEGLGGALPANASASDAAQVTRQINNMVAGGVDVSEAAGVALGAFELGLDVDAIVGLSLDEGIDLPTAFNLQFEADRRDMTIAEYHAYNGIRDETTFAVIDTALGGNADGKVSIEDIDYVIAHPDDYTAEVVAAAVAFRQSTNVMARLDTARDFSDNVIDHDGFGRTRLDDLLWSRADIDNFEFKQNLNFTLASHVDLIDTAGEGGRVDGHLSKADFQSTLDRAEELDLSAAEITALTTVINGQLYDQNWLERNRDSIALAAAVVAGTAIFVSTGGLGAGLSVGLVTSVAAATTGGAVAAGVTTMGINSVTQEDLDDGVNANMIQGGILAGLSGPGIASGGAGWGTASVFGKGVIGAGMASEGAGLIGAGAMDWAIDNPFFEGDHIDIANTQSNYDKAGLILAGGTLTASLAGGHHLIDNAITSAGQGARRPLDPPRAVLNGTAEIGERIDGVNPGFTGDPFDPRSNNCGSCAEIVHNRLNGSGLDAVAGTHTYSIPEMELLTGLPQSALSPTEIERALTQAGPGSTAVIGIDRSTGPGHWFNAYYDGRQVYYVDGQSGLVSEWPPTELGEVTHWDASIVVGGDQ